MDLLLFETGSQMDEAKSSGELLVGVCRFRAFGSRATGGNLGFGCETDTPLKGADNTDLGKGEKPSLRLDELAPGVECGALSVGSASVCLP